MHVDIQWITLASFGLVLSLLLGSGLARKLVWRQLLLLLAIPTTIASSAATTAWLWSASPSSWLGSQYYESIRFVWAAVMLWILTGFMSVIIYEEMKRRRRQAEQAKANSLKTMPIFFDEGETPKPASKPFSVVKHERIDVGPRP